MLDATSMLVIEVEELRAELEFLRFFYSEARYAMGPADSDIYDMIKEDFVKGGGVLPKDYALEEEEGEEEGEEDVEEE